MLKSIANIFKSYHFIFQHISLRQRFFLIGLIIIIFFAASLDILVLYLIGLLLSNNNFDVNINSFEILNKEQIVFFIIIFTIIAAYFRIFSSKLSLSIGDKIYVNFSLKIYNLIFNREIEFIDRVNVDRLTSLIFNNASRIPEFIYFFQSVISSIFLILLTLIFSSFLINPFILLLLFASASSVYIISSIISSYKTRNLGLSLTKAYEDLSRLFRKIFFLRDF